MTDLLELTVVLVVAGNIAVQIIRFLGRDAKDDIDMTFLGDMLAACFFPFILKSDEGAELRQLEE